MEQLVAIPRTQPIIALPNVALEPDDSVQRAYRVSQDFAAWLSDRLEQSMRDVADLHAVVSDSRHRNEHAAALHQLQIDELQELRAQAHSLLAELTVINAELADRQRHIDELRRSSSWRITGPLRRASRFLRKLRVKRAVDDVHPDAADRSAHSAR